MYLANSIYQEEQEKNEPVNKKKEEEEFKFYRRIRSFQGTIEGKIS